LNHSSKKYLIVIAGATAVGKTEICLKLAKKLSTEIISADSRQFFREMNIGTAKPSKEELTSVKHHFINSHSIEEEYNVGKYEEEALTLLEKLFEKYQYLILTGGSGLYIKAVCEGLDKFPKIAPEIRENLNQVFKENGIEFLLEKLKEMDFEYYQKVDKANPQRIIRALEICIGTGETFSSFRSGEKKKHFFENIKIALERPREELYQRIELRMDKMLAEGLVKEAQELLPFKDTNALQTVGYQEVYPFLADEYDELEMIRLLKRNSRRYAKRQTTWFKKDKEFRWFSPNDFDKIYAFIREGMT